MRLSLRLLLVCVILGAGGIAAAMVGMSLDGSPPIPIPDAAEAARAHSAPLAPVPGAPSATELPPADSAAPPATGAESTSVSPPEDGETPASDEFPPPPPDGPLVHLAGIVVLPDGAPAPGCRVAFRDLWYSRLADPVTTDTEGRFRYAGPEPATGEIVVTPSEALAAAGYAGLVRSGLLNQAAAAGSPVPEVTIVLVRGEPGVVWRVPGADSSSLSVILRTVTADSQNVFHGLTPATAAFDGTSFHLTPEPGMWRLALHAEGAPPWVTPPFLVTEGLLTDLGVLTPPVPARLDLDVCAQDGERLANVTATLDDPRALLSAFGLGVLPVSAGGAHGVFSFGLLPPGPLGVSIATDNGGRGRIDVTLAEGEHAVRRFVADAYATVQVRAVTESGDPISGLSVSCGGAYSPRSFRMSEYDNPNSGGGWYGGRSGGIRGRRTTSAGLASFRVPAGSAPRISASFGEGAASEVVQLPPLETGEVREVVIVRPSAGLVPVEGTIRDTAGPAQYAQVAAILVEPMVTGTAATASETGAWTASPVRPGAVRLRWDARGSWGIASGQWSGTPVASGGSPIEIVLPDGTVRVRVTHGTAALSHARVQLTSAEAGASGVTGDDGTVTFVHLQAGEYAVSVEAPGHPRTASTLLVAGGDNGERTVPADPPRAIAVTGVPAEGHVVVYDENGNRLAWTWSGKTDPAVVVLGGLPQTRVLVTVTGPGRAPFRTPLIATSPPAQLTAVLPAGTVVYVKPGASAAEVRVPGFEAYPKTKGLDTAHVDAPPHGYPVLIVPRGPVVVLEWRRTADPGAPWQRIEIAANAETVELVLPE